MKPLNSSFFDASYFASGCGRPYLRDAEWRAAFNHIARHIISSIAPKTVLDAGCAIGLLVESLRERDIEAWGIDLSDFAIGQAPDNIRPYCQVQSVTAPLGRRYDLIVCIEVLEHMSNREAEAAVLNFCQHSDDILFSSSPEDYKEPTHFNVQPPEYWAELFARQNFFRDVEFDASFITPWAVRFRRGTEPFARVIRHYERGYWAIKSEARQLREQALTLRNAAAQAQAAELDTETLRARAQAAEHENEALRALTRAYEQGRFMRLMRWLKGEKSA